MRTKKFNIDKLVEKLMELYPGLLKYANGQDIEDNVCFVDHHISECTMFIDSYIYNPHEISFENKSKDIYLNLSLTQMGGYMSFCPYRDLPIETRVMLYDLNISLNYRAEDGDYKRYETQSVVRYKTIGEIIAYE